MLSCSSDFYSRASREARHETAKKTYDKFTFLLTRLSRGATVSKIQEALSFLISTHAPLARRDTDSIFVNIPAWISTHAPLARRDFPHYYIFPPTDRFLLTRLSRGATFIAIYFISFSIFLLTRLSRGATELDTSK